MRVTQAGAYTTFLGMPLLECSGLGGFMSRGAAPCTKAGACRQRACAAVRDTAAHQALVHRPGERLPWACRCSIQAPCGR